MFTLTAFLYRHYRWRQPEGCRGAAALYEKLCETPVREIYYFRTSTRSNIGISMHTSVCISTCSAGVTTLLKENAMLVNRCEKRDGEKWQRIKGEKYSARNLQRGERFASAAEYNFHFSGVRERVFFPLNIEKPSQTVSVRNRFIKSR